MESRLLNCRRNAEIRSVFVTQLTPIDVNLDEMAKSLRRRIPSPWGVMGNGKGCRDFRSIRNLLCAC